MKLRPNWIVTAVIVSALGVSFGADAALVSRLGGTAYYDTELNITWTANADINGPMNWATADTWATNLVVGSVSGWRLPTTLQPDVTCGTQFPAGVSSGLNCTGSELGHLFYTELGGAAGSSITTVHNDSYSLFSNVRSGIYWSNTDYAPDTRYAWSFNFASGSQDARDKVLLAIGRAWAVHPGDVAAVPVPDAVWLFGSALVGLFGVVRKRKAAE